jgi:hypothetical protein
MWSCLSAGRAVCGTAAAVPHLLQRVSGFGQFRPTDRKRDGDCAEAGNLANAVERRLSGRRISILPAGI